MTADIAFNEENINLMDLSQTRLEYSLTTVKQTKDTRSEQFTCTTN